MSNDLRSRVEAAMVNEVPVLVVQVADLVKLYETMDNLDEIARMAYEGEDIDWDN